jgi:N-ethylmaleimide reductase
VTLDINLFSPIKLGPYTLSNRMVMAPMTRLRAIGTIPQPIMAIYYAQRASAGLIVTECTMVSPLSYGYMNCPGIYSGSIPILQKDGVRGDLFAIVTRE